VGSIDQGMGVLGGGGERRKGRGSFGVNLGRPIVTNGDLVHSCAEMHEPIELSFGVVSGIGSGIHVLDAGACDFFYNNIYEKTFITQVPL